MSDRRLHFPATTRNQAPILAELERVWPGPATVLEIASGSGEHGLAFTRSRPDWRWQPTDLEPAHLDSIEAWRELEGPPNLLPPLALDVLAPWPVLPEPPDAGFCANMIHIAPPQTVAALFRGWQRVLTPGASVALYGPFQRDGRHTAESNAAFHRRLQERDPGWGVRHLEDVVATATASGWSLAEVVDMPANNLLVVFTST